MKKFKFLNDPSLLMLIATNLWLIYSYYQNPDTINNIIILFYIQSILIGLVNVLELYTLNNFTGKELLPASMANKKDGCFALFFAVHYGAFHFVYLFFLAGIIDFHKVDYLFIRSACLVLAAGAIINFIHDKMRNRYEPVNSGVMFFMPYARIIPMHLMILAPEFLSISRSMVFLILKMVADVVMFLVQRNLMFAPAKNKTVGVNDEGTFI